MADEEKTDFQKEAEANENGGADAPSEGADEGAEAPSEGADEGVDAPASE